MFATPPPPLPAHFSHLFVCGFWGVCLSRVSVCACVTFPASGSLFITV